MGYRTEFKLKAVHVDGSPAPLPTLAEIRQVTPEANLGWEPHELERWFGGCDWDSIETGLVSTSEVKWYDYLDHMQLVSAHWPDLVFILDGEGEQRFPPDTWRKFFLRGYCVEWHTSVWHRDDVVSEFDERPELTPELWQQMSQDLE